MILDRKMEELWKLSSLLSVREMMLIGHGVSDSQQHPWWKKLLNQELFFFFFF